MKRLKDKVVIITRAAQDMGKMHAEKALNEGAKVVITDINKELGLQTSQILGEKAIFIQHDVANEEHWSNVISIVIDKWGRIDVLVNNEVITYSTPLEELSLAAYMKLVNINQVSVFLGMKTVAETMKAQNAGSIINISSMNGLLGGAIGYTDTKFTVRGMIKAASRELSPFNIRVNPVYPEVIQPPILEQ
jgi:3alpha(or 20beta)-hydroxysteroid dehydrogenase